MGRVLESEAASAEEQVAEAVELAELAVEVETPVDNLVAENSTATVAELAVEVEVPVDNLVVENSTATVVHNLVAELAVGEVEIPVDNLAVENSTATVVHNLVGD